MAENAAGKATAAVLEAADSPAQAGASYASEEGRGESSTPEPKEDIESMLKRLEITAEEEDAVDLSGLIEENRSSIKWAVIIRVCLKTPFSNTVFYQKMQVAWAVAQEVSFRDLDEFTFIAQFKCLGDWKTAMHGGPWLFRRNAVVIEEYDGLVNTEMLALDSIRVWVRIMGLPELVRNEPAARAMAVKMGEVLEVELGMNGAPYVKFVRVYMRIKLKKPLLRFVSGSVEPGKAPQKFRVLYEKMPQFCAQCGLIGHVANECGDGAHDPKKFQYGDFMMAPQEDFWYQPTKEYVARPQASGGRGRGRGRGGRSGAAFHDENVHAPNTIPKSTDDPRLKKRDLGARDRHVKSNTLAIMPSSHVASVVESMEGNSRGDTTPQKMQVPKRHKAGTPAEGLADSREEGRQEQ
jgi:hypothetical protein